MEWRFVLAGAIVVASLVVLWRTFDPRSREAQDEASRVPLREDP